MDIEARNNLVKAWKWEKEKLDEIKLSEMSFRRQVTAELFPNPVKGTQRYQLDNQGYAVKLVYKLNYKLGDKEKINPETGAKVRIDDQVFELQIGIEQLGEVATLLADRLIKWSPELSVTEYEKLDLNDPLHVQIKKMIDAMLTVEPAAPSLEFEEPKVKV